MSSVPRVVKTCVSTPRFPAITCTAGFAEYALVPTRFAYPIPSIFSDAEAAPLLCAGIIGFRALRRSRLKPGQRLGLYGFGASAHITIQIARHWGCPVYVFSRRDTHQRLAEQLGATWVGHSTESPPEKLHASIVFAPVGHLVPHALQALERGGTVAMAGIYSSDVPSLVYDRDLFHERSLRSVTANTRQDGLDLFRVAAEIPIRTQTQAFRLEEANQALQSPQSRNDQWRGDPHHRVTVPEGCNNHCHDTRNSKLSSTNCRFLTTKMLSSQVMIMIGSEICRQLMQVGFGYRLGDLQNFCPDGCFQFSPGRASGGDLLRTLWATMRGVRR